MLVSDALLRLKSQLGRYRVKEVPIAAQSMDPKIKERKKDPK
jgi:hypothetical protein